jgi:FkbM family methyltransferase
VTRVSLTAITAAVFVRAGTADVEVLNQIFHLGELDLRLESEPEFVVDAGANIGMTAVLLANRYPSAKIVGLEIDSANFELLERNTAACANVEAWNKGLWSHATRISIENPADEPWAFRAAEWTTDAIGEAVDAVGVADILRMTGWPRIDLLKIDIEGGEVEVFSAGTEEWIDRVAVIAIELHDRTRPSCTAMVEAAVAGHDFVVSESGEYRIYARQR